MDISGQVQTVLSDIHVHSMMFDVPSRATDVEQYSAARRATLQKHTCARGSPRRRPDHCSGTHTPPLCRRS